MTKAADVFNMKQIELGLLKPEHITELVAHWQDTHTGLTVDGMAGSAQTIPSIAKGLEALVVVSNGWLVGSSVRRIDAHPSWYGGPVETGAPRGIVAHFTDTAPGTAVSMANRRARKFGLDADDRLASWHITIETNGSIVVMIPMSHRAWHAGSPTALPVPGLGGANANTIGIELVGFGKEFPAPQVASAAMVWRTIVRHYGIDRRFAMITHQSIDPSRRDDPGPVWMGQHAPGVLAAAYA
jgi:hypothetical protein